MNKILAIPKHKIQCDNGITFTNTNDIWSTYGKDMIYMDINQDFKLFYKIIPYLIIEHKNRYLVHEDGGFLCFNPSGLSYIKQRLAINPIRSIIDYNADKYTKTHSGIKVFSFIRNISKYPNELAAVYIMSLKTYKKPRNFTWMTLEDLIDQCRQFDCFAIEYINYLIIQKYKK